MFPVNLYIKKAFINGRRLHGTTLSQNPRGYRTVQDYFFDPDLLTDGAPPNDRGCRACGKVGGYNPGGTLIHSYLLVSLKETSDQLRRL
jgi:hypothetical protein